MPPDPSRNDHLIPGTSLGPYTIQALLGSGGMGEVYLARDTRLLRNVAVKVLPSELASDADRRQRFEREARAAASLNHPHIVSVYDVGVHDGTPFLVMEYIRGETLAARLLRERVPRHRALQIGSEIAAALDEAHTHRIVHRDLKPANVMLTLGGSVKVLDFGIAKTLLPEPAPTGTAAANEMEETSPGQLVGTPAYMSPEQLLGHFVDHHSDVYSLGVILFELFTGRRPFAANDVTGLRQAVLDSTAPSASAADPTVPESIDGVIAQAMARAPGARPPAAVVKAELDAIAMRRLPVHPDVASVAVLSFTDMSASKDQEYFCDGMADELINALTQISGVRVAARTSAFQFKGKARDVRVIGRALNVASVVDGSVRKTGGRLRVTIELISTASGYQLWSQRFDRDLEDLFDVQDEIAHAVVAAIREKLSAETGEAVAVPRPRNLNAYASYLEGRYHWNKRSEDELRRSVICFQQAIAFDSRYAPAYIGLADAYLTLGTYGAMPPGEIVPRAGEAIEKALEIDGDLAEAYTCRGCLRSVYQWDWSEGEWDFRKSIAVNPRYPTAHHWYAINHLVPLGRFAEATDALHSALDLDPLALAIKASLGIKSYFSGRYEDAAEKLLNTLEVDAGFGVAYFFLGATYTEEGRYAEARTALDSAVRVAGRTPDVLAALGYLHGRAGDVQQARQILDDLRQLSARRYVSPARLAQVHVGLGEAAEALDLLETGEAERAADLAWVAVRPVFTSLRSDPRFEALLQRMRLSGAPSTRSSRTPPPAWR